MIEITPLKIISYFPLRFKTSFLTCFSVSISRLEMGIIYLIHILIHFFYHIHILKSWLDCVMELLN